MTQPQILLLILLAATVALFVWHRWRHDLVAVATLVAAVLLGLVPIDRAFLGFSHPAVITVVAVLIISHGLRSSGVVDAVAQQLQPLTRGRLLHIGVLLVTVTVASAFMNNVGALALLLPVALATAAERQRAPATLLMPLAFASLLGGMTTLIGTPPTIIIAAYRAEALGTPFAMFDYMPVGLAVAAVGVAFLVLVGWRLVPAERRSAGAGQPLFEVERYVAEARVPLESPIIGEPLGSVREENDDVIVVGVAHGATRLATAPGRLVAANDILLVRGDPDPLQHLVDRYHLELLDSGASTRPAEEPSAEQSDDSQKKEVPQQRVFAEAVIRTTSPLVGRYPSYLSWLTDDRVALVAVARAGRPIDTRLTDLTLQAGDVLLLQSAPDETDRIFDAGLLPLARRPIRLGQPRRIITALVVFGAALALGSSGVVSLPLALIATAAVYVVLGILSERELYSDVDWPTIVLLGAMLPLGEALERTDTTTLFANGILYLTQDLTPVAVLTLLLVATMIVSDIVNNAATALVMAPIALQLSRSLECNGDPFLMAVAVGASCAFLTPVGHQSNTIVMAPGGYRFGDYWRVGLPLELVIVAVAVPAILFVWPL
ncbi:MAG: SLC13 family permease [Luteitalea sp.]|nr:SLC13 family permease [Luteitalea sp.]